MSEIINLHKLQVKTFYGLTKEWHSTPQSGQSSGLLCRCWPLGQSSLLPPGNEYTQGWESNPHTTTQFSTALEELNVFLLHFSDTLLEDCGVYAILTNILTDLLTYFTAFWRELRRLLCTQTMSITCKYMRDHLWGAL